MKRISKKNKGFALIWATIITLLFLIIASSMIILIVKELRITANIDESNRAYLAAEAGMERALYELKLLQDTTFGWCGSSPAYARTLQPVPDELTYSARLVGTTKPGVSDCDNIVVESTGVDKGFTNRKLQLKIVYGPNTNMERYDTDLAAPPAFPPPGLRQWYSAAHNYYLFPNAAAQNKPLIIQQFDMFDLTSMSNNQELFIGMGLGGATDFGIKIKRVNLTNNVDFSIFGKLNAANIFSSSPVQRFSIAGNPKFRFVIEYSRVSQNFTAIRAIVLKNNSALDEKYSCPNTDKSYVVYSSLSITSADPAYVAVSTTSLASPSWEKILGNGYLKYPSGAKLDNMVFWGRE